MCVLFLSAGVDYEYKAVNLVKGEQSDPGALVLLLTCGTYYLMLQLLEHRVLGT
jgi:hypothetical protein